MKFENFFEIMNELSLWPSLSQAFPFQKVDATFSATVSKIMRSESRVTTFCKVKFVKVLKGQKD